MFQYLNDMQTIKITTNKLNIYQLIISKSVRLTLCIILIYNMFVLSKAIPISIRLQLIFS